MSGRSVRQWSFNKTLKSLEMKTSKVYYTNTHVMDKILLIILRRIEAKEWGISL